MVSLSLNLCFLSCFSHPLDDFKIMSRWDMRLPLKTTVMKRITFSLQIPYYHNVPPTYFKILQEVQKPKDKHKYYPARTVYPYWNKIYYKFMSVNLFSSVFAAFIKKKKKSARLCNTGIVAMNIINTFFASSSKKASESINPQVLRMPNTHVSALKYNKMQLLLHQTR